MARSSLIDERLKSRAVFRKATGIGLLVMLSLYMIWRVTIFSENWLFSLLFYLCELLSFLMVFTMIFSSWNYRHREAKPAKAGLTVDVFLPVYREPIEMIRQTVRAAARISYPHETYLLDDGKRDEIKALAEEFGVRYIRRTVNQGAKAGNMNHALQYATGDCVFVFDADHIAQAEAIDALLGFFDDPKVGLVITPQDYYNLDGLQFLHHGSGRIWHDQSRFYNLIQGCKDSDNCATSCGTGVMYRRAALDEIGGFAELTVTEDVHVTLLMHERGWESVYFNESIAYGVAPADLADYYRTRERWAHGNLHVLSAEKPWKNRRLSGKQRFSYLELGIIYLECWQQLLLFLVPVMSLFFAWQPFEITPLNVLIVLFFPLLMMLLLDEQGCGMNRNWTSQLFAIARMPIQIISWAAVFGRKLRWRVSQKNLDGQFQWSLVMPQLFLTLISLAALIYGLAKIPQINSTGPVIGMLNALWHRMMNDASPSDYFGAHGIHEVLKAGYSWDLLLISSFWTIYNGSRAAYWIYDTYRRTKNTHAHYRFRIPLIVEFSSGERQVIEWVSETSFRVASSLPCHSVKESMELSLWLPAGPLKVKARVSEVKKDSYVAEILWSGHDQRDQLCDALYSMDWHAEMHQREGYFPTFFERITQFLLLKKAAIDWQWVPGLMRTDHSEQFSYVLLGSRSGEPPTQLLGFRDHREQGNIRITFPDGTDVKCILGKKRQLQGICEVGLDRCRRWRAEIVSFCLLT